MVRLTLSVKRFLIRIVQCFSLGQIVLYVVDDCTSLTSLALTLLETSLKNITLDKIKDKRYRFYRDIGKRLEHLLTRISY